MCNFKATSDLATTCHRCESFQIKIIMGLIAPGVRCHGICDNDESEVYYVSMKSTCDLFEKRT